MYPKPHGRKLQTHCNKISARPTATDPLPSHAPSWPPSMYASRTPREMNLHCLYWRGTEHLLGSLIMDCGHKPLNEFIDSAINRKVWNNRVMNLVWVWNWQVSLHPLGAICNNNNNPHLLANFWKFMSSRLVYLEFKTDTRTNPPKNLKYKTHLYIIAMDLIYLPEWVVKINYRFY